MLQLLSLSQITRGDIALLTTQLKPTATKKVLSSRFEHYMLKSKTALLSVQAKALLIVADLYRSH